VDIFQSVSLYMFMFSVKRFGSIQGFNRNDFDSKSLVLRGMCVENFPLSSTWTTPPGCSGRVAAAASSAGGSDP
jgi:hypothetical protein